MEKAVIVCFVLCLLCFTVNCQFIELDIVTEIQNTICDANHENERNKHVFGAQCKRPREMLVVIPAPTVSIKVIPQAVFVNRCVGVCYHSRRACMPRSSNSTRTVQIPVRYVDVRNGTERCGFYSLTEHLECGCARVT